ncbi:hypothetical protein H1R20_g799, partial [Candolleomyces eurysporus]
MMFIYAGFLLNFNSEDESPRLVEHLPTLDDIDLVLEVIACVHLILFLTALHPGSYLPGRSNVLYATSLSREQRLLFCTMRGMALDFVIWFCSSYSITRIQRKSTTSVEAPAEDVDFGRVWKRAFGALGLTIYHYKRSAEDEGHRGVEGCSSERLLEELRASVQLVGSGAASTFEDGLLHSKSSHDDSLDMLDFQLDASYSYHVGRRSVPVSNVTRIIDFAEAGKTVLDKAYFDGLDGEDAESSGTSGDERPQKRSHTVYS